MRSLPKNSLLPLNFLATRTSRKVLFSTLYMSEGAPVGFIWWALPTLLRSHGVPVENITALTSLLILPWALKFLWAPLVDVFQHRWPLRLWILTTQLLMGLTILPLMFLDFEREFTFLGFLLLIHSIASATQDVSIDALCIRVTSVHERGALNGWMQAGMLTSRSLLGGGSLVVMEAWGLAGVIGFLVSMIWSSSIVVWFTSDTPPFEAAAGQPRLLLFLRKLRSAFSFRSTWYGLLFAVLAGAGFEAAGAVAGPFLIDRGFSSEDVGWFFLIPAVLATIAGSVVGGYVADRLKRLLAVKVFLVAMSGSVILLGALEYLDLSGFAIGYLGGLSLLYFCIGLFISSSYALFMDLTNPELGATQFSAYMGGTNLCESWSGLVMGRLVGGWSYAAGFLIMGLVSLCTLPLVGRLERHLPEAENGAAT